MSLADRTIKITYPGDNSTVNFAMPDVPIVDDSAEVKVYIRDESVSPITQTLQTEGVDYNLTGSPGGDAFHTTVTFSVAPVSTDKVVIYLELPLTQLLDLTTANGLPPESLEQGYDRAVGMIQQLNEQLTRVPKLRVSEQISEAGMELPEPGADEVWAWNAGGTAITTLDAAALATLVESLIDHTAIQNIGSNSHAQIDTHIASTSNPHSVTLDQIGPGVAKGDIIVFDGVNHVKLSQVSDGKILSSNSATATGLEWIDDAVSTSDETVKVTSNDSNQGYLFDKVIAGSSKLSVTEINDGGNEDLELDVVEANIVHQNLSGAGSNTHAQIDTHIADTTIHFTAASLSSTYATIELDNLGTTAINADLNMTGTNTLILQNDVALEGIYSGIPREIIKLHNTGRIYVGDTLRDIFMQGDTLPSTDGTYECGNTFLRWLLCSADQFEGGGGMTLQQHTSPSSTTVVGVQTNSTIRAGLLTLNQTAGSTDSAAIYIESGNATGATSDSGDINLRTGTATQNRGTINLQDGSLAGSSVGYIWALDNTSTGAGSWTNSTFIDHDTLTNFVAAEHISLARHIYVDPSGTNCETTLNDALTAASALTPTATNPVFIFMAAGSHTIDNSISTPVVPQDVYIFGTGKSTRILGASNARAILAMRSRTGFLNARINIGSTFKMFEIDANGVNPDQIVLFEGLICESCGTVFDMIDGKISAKNCSTIQFGVGTLVDTANLAAASTGSLIEGWSFEDINTIIDTQTTAFNFSITVTKCTVTRTAFNLGRLFEMNSGTLISTYNTFGGTGTVIYDLDGTATLQDDYCTQTGTYTNNFLTAAAGVTVVSNYGKWDETDFSLFVEDHRPNTYFDTNTGKFINAGDSNSFVEIPLLEYTNFFE